MKMRLRTGWVMILGFAFSGITAADPAVNGDAPELAKQIERLQTQIGAMHDDMAKLSDRLNKLEARVPKPQEPERVNVNLDGAHVLGDQQAKLGIVEFADFQCPYCRHFYQDVFPQLKKSYFDTGKVSFIVRNFPLDFHAHAMNAALAVSCVAKQDNGAYWDIQRELFNNQKRFGPDYFAGLARHYGLDEARYQACMKDPDQKKSVENDLNYATTLGVTGTPTFFIGSMKGDRLVNAVRIEGVQPYEVFSKVLDYIKKHEEVADNTNN